MDDGTCHQTGVKETFTVMQMVISTCTRPVEDMAHQAHNGAVDPSKRRVTYEFLADGPMSAEHIYPAG